MRYIINDAPIGGWIDTETNTSFTDQDPESATYKEFVAWLDEGNTPGDAFVPETSMAPVPVVTVGEQFSDDDLIAAKHHLREYFEFATPNEEYTAATLKTLIRVVLHGTA